MNEGTLKIQAKTTKTKRCQEDNLADKIMAASCTLFGGTSLVVSSAGAGYAFYSGNSDWGYLMLGCSLLSSLTLGLGLFGTSAGLGRRDYEKIKDYYKSKQID